MINVQKFIGIAASLLVSSSATAGYWMFDGQSPAWITKGGVKPSPEGLKLNTTGMARISGGFPLQDNFHLTVKFTSVDGFTDYLLSTDSGFIIDVPGELLRSPVRNHVLSVQHNDGVTNIWLNGYVMDPRHVTLPSSFEYETFYFWGGDYTCLIHQVELSTDTPVSDWNLDGEVNISDLYQYLESWLAGDNLSDINHNSVISIVDLIEFINMWIGIR